MKAVPEIRLVIHDRSRRMRQGSRTGSLMPHSSYALSALFVMNHQP